MENIMIDIETLDVRPTAVILSIGAVEFGSEGIGKTFYSNVGIGSCLSAGRTISESTLCWWMEQSEEARLNAFVSGAQPLASVLIALRAAFDWNSAKVWANGAEFDLPILGSSFDAVDMQQPWSYFNSRCFRTLKNSVPKSVYRDLKSNPKTAHKALDDAIAKAETAIVLLDYQEKSYGAYAEHLTNQAPCSYRGQ